MLILYSIEGSFTLVIIIFNTFYYNIVIVSSFKLLFFEQKMAIKLCRKIDYDLVLTLQEVYFLYLSDRKFTAILFFFKLYFYLGKKSWVYLYIHISCI